MSTDENNRPDQIRVTREVPLWGILTFLAGLFVEAAAMYYGMVRLGEEQLRQGLRQTEMAQDIRAIAADIQKGNIKTVELSFGLQSLEQRVRLLEARPVK